MESIITEQWKVLVPHTPHPSWLVQCTALDTQPVYWLHQPWELLGQTEPCFAGDKQSDAFLWWRRREDTGQWVAGASSDHWKHSWAVIMSIVIGDKHPPLPPPPYWLHITFHLTLLAGSQWAGRGLTLRLVRVLFYISCMQSGNQDITNSPATSVHILSRGLDRLGRLRKRAAISRREIHFNIVTSELIVDTISR